MTLQGAGRHGADSFVVLMEWHGAIMVCCYELGGSIYRKYGGMPEIWRVESICLARISLNLTWQLRL